MIFDYLWGTLDAQTAASIKAHLESGCLSCNHELELIQGPSYALSGELSPIPPPAEHKQEVMNRVGGLVAPLADEFTSHTSYTANNTSNPVQLSNAQSLNPHSSRKRWVLALAGCLIGIVGGYAAVHSARDTVDQLSQQQSAHNNAHPTGNGIRMVKLASTDAADAKGTPAAGHVVFDTIANQVHILTSNLLDSSPTAQYNVWLTDEKNQNVLLGKLQKSETQGVWFNYFDLPHTLMNINEIAIARSSTSASNLSPADVRLRVHITPPVILQ